MICCEVEFLLPGEYLAAVLLVLDWDPGLAECGRNRRYGEVPGIAVSLVAIPSNGQNH